MKRSRALVLSVVSFGLASACATGPRVAVERAPGNALARYEMFAVQPDGDAPASDPAFGPAARRAAQEEVELLLRQRGYRLVHPDDAEFLVAVSSVTTLHIDGGDVPVRPGGPAVRTTQTGVGTPLGTIPTGRQTTVVQAPPSVSVDPVRERVERTIVVDVFDAETRDLLWRGKSTMEPRSSQRIDDEALQARVRAIAARFPAS